MSIKMIAKEKKSINKILVFCRTLPRVAIILQVARKTNSVMTGVATLMKIMIMTAPLRSNSNYGSSNNNHKSNKKEEETRVTPFHLSNNDDDKYNTKNIIKIRFFTLTLRQPI